MSIKTDDLIRWFGRDLMAGCTAVVEQLAEDGDDWRMSRTYKYRDGSERVFISPASEGTYFVLPAAPGFQELQLPVNDDRGPTIDDVQRHPVVAWRWGSDNRTQWLTPYTPGENTTWGNTASAVLSPDGILVVLSSYDLSGEDPREKGGFTEQSFPTVESWVAAVAECWAKRRAWAEEKRKAAEANKCPTCGVHRDDDLPF